MHEAGDLFHGVNFLHYESQMSEIYLHPFRFAVSTNCFSSLKEVLYLGYRRLQLCQRSSQEDEYLDTYIGVGIIHESVQKLHGFPDA